MELPVHLLRGAPPRAFLGLGGPPLEVGPAQHLGEQALSRRRPELPEALHPPAHGVQHVGRDVRAKRAPGGQDQPGQPQQLGVLLEVVAQRARGLPVQAGLVQAAQDRPVPLRQAPGQARSGVEVRPGGGLHGVVLEPLEVDPRSVQVQNVEGPRGRGLQDPPVVGGAPLLVLRRGKPVVAGLGDAEEDPLDPGLHGVVDVVDQGAAHHVQRVAQEAWVLASGAHHQVTGPQAAQQGPGAVDGVDHPGLPLQGLHHGLQGLQLVPPARLLAVQDGQAGPVRRAVDAEEAGRGVGVVVHHPQEVRLEAPGEGHVRGGHGFPGHVLQPEVMPERERRAVHPLSCQSRLEAIYTIHGVCVRSDDHGSSRIRVGKPNRDALPTGWRPGRFQARGRLRTSRGTS